MMFFKSFLSLSALLVMVSAMTLERNDYSEITILIGTDAKTNGIKGPSFLVSKSDCEKEDEDDCKEFCALSEQTGTCRADGNKVTCYCKGGKSDSNCEERCLLCMPDKTALEEASRLFKLGGSKIDEL